MFVVSQSLRVRNVPFGVFFLYVIIIFRCVLFVLNRVQNVLYFPSFVVYLLFAAVASYPLVFLFRCVLFVRDRVLIVLCFPTFGVSFLYVYL